MSFVIEAHNYIVSSQNASGKSPAENCDPNGVKEISSSAAPAPENPGAAALVKLFDPNKDGKDPKASLDATYDELPPELTALPQWVCSTKQKMPLDPKTLKATSSTDPATWGTHEQALARFQNGECYAIGFVFTSSDPYVGLDLDDCYGGEDQGLAPEAESIIQQFGSTYAERSQSGTGVKLIVRGKKPGKNCVAPTSFGQLEMYEQAKFFPLTGWRLDDAPSTVAEAQNAIESVYEEYLEKEEDEPEGDLSAPPPSGLSDEEVIARLGQIPRIKDLFEGHWKSYYASQNQADLALCNQIARHVGNDPVQIDRIFRASGLNREKWETREDYRTWTIEKALEWAARTDVFANFYEVTMETENSWGKVVKKSVKVGLPAKKISDRLLQVTGGFPKAGGKLFFRGKDGAPLWVENTSALFAYIGHFYQGTDRNRVRWVTSDGQGDKLPREHFHEHLLKVVEQYDAVELYPHWPELDRHYYVPMPSAGGDGEALKKLLEYFCPALDVDKSLLKALFLTGAWGGPGGSRPGFVISSEDAGDQRKGCGVGKTTLARVFASLFGGSVDLGQQETLERLKVRLLSPGAQDLRVVLLDNLKSYHFSSGDLEGTITAKTISGHQLYTGERQRANTFTYVITVSGPALGKDLAERSVNIRLKRPDAYNPGWQAEVETFVETNRWAILRDIVAELQKPELPLDGYTRWAAWERWVLSKCDKPNECLKALAKRRAEMDDDQAEAAEIREEFVKDLRRCNLDPETCVIRYFSSDAWRVVVNATGDSTLSYKKSTSLLKTMPIAELSYDHWASGRGFIWRGKRSAVGQKPEHIGAHRVA
jgi:hypothetical protein